LGKYRKHTRRAAGCFHHSSNQALSAVNKRQHGIVDLDSVTTTAIHGERGEQSGRDVTTDYPRRGCRVLRARGKSQLVSQSLVFAFKSRQPSLDTLVVLETVQEILVVPAKAPQFSHGPRSIRDPASHGGKNLLNA
jgi:hypothetical protein